MSQAEATSKSVNPSDACPCGSGKPFAACCAPVIEGTRLAATAEELMRARFTAHATHAFQFLHESFRGTASKPYVPEEGQPGVEWKRLDVHSHETTENPDRSFVDFTAYGTERGQEVVHQERAEFLRTNGSWLYTREVRLGPPPVKASSPKVGRNDPCPCGSGKKYKHCCLAKA